MNLMNQQRLEWLQAIENNTKTIPIEELVIVTGKPSPELQPNALRHWVLTMSSFTAGGSPTTLESKWLYKKADLAHILLVLLPEDD